jgi:hypothetical protein
VDVSELLARLRIIKSDDEIGLLTLAGRVAQAGARAFLDAVHPGVTESEIAGSAVLAMNRSLAVSSPACLSSSYAYCQAGEHTLTTFASDRKAAPYWRFSCTERLRSRMRILRRARANFHRREPQQGAGAHLESGDSLL